MVKNVKGGSGHKSQARKFSGTSTSKQNSKLRIVEEEGEIYAQVTKIFGNCMCDVLCIDNKTRLCFIRGKFRGRGKRDNTIKNGSWIIVGKRDWETEKINEKEKCDLIEVYSDFDVDRLKKNVNENWKTFVNLDVSKSSVHEDEYFKFENSDTEEYEDIIQNLEKVTNIRIQSNSNNDTMEAPDTEEVNIDDI
jgi:initiation factor 1A